MLAEIGVQNIDALFDSVPDSLKLGDTLLDLPESLSESDLTGYLKRLQKKNATAENHSIFLGAGAYHHFSPVLIDHQLHPLPTGSQSGDSSSHLRISDHDLSANRHGDCQCFHV